MGNKYANNHEQFPLCRLLLGFSKSSVSNAAIWFETCGSTRYFAWILFVCFIFSTFDIIIMYLIVCLNYLFLFHFVAGIAGGRMVSAPAFGPGGPGSIPDGVGHFFPTMSLGKTDSPSLWVRSLGMCTVCHRKVHWTSVVITRTLKFKQIFHRRQCIRFSIPGPN